MLQEKNHRDSKIKAVLVFLHRESKNQYRPDFRAFVEAKAI